MNHGPRAVGLRVHDAERGAGYAYVDCPRQHVRMPVLVCRACERCLRVAEREDGIETSVVCMLR